jgi:dihydrofolate synthase/folylpolyglutamate synthase
MSLTYRQALEYIFSFDDPYLAALRDHGKPTWGLETVRRLLKVLGDPHLAYPTIHVAGTKGKGSTAAFITQCLVESGIKTGLYISPHLQDWRERIQVDRGLISEEALTRLVEDFQPYAEGFHTLSVFEVSTALALWHFAREGCGAAVVEVGLGGRLDATSVVEPVVAVITNISFDHTQLLGDTLAEIAGEKAAIIKPGVPVVSAPQPPEARIVIEEQARQAESSLTMVGREWHTRILSQDWDGSRFEINDGMQTRTFTIHLPGPFQVENAAVAMAALEVSGLPVTQEGVAQGLARTQWAGRLEVVSQRPHIVLDSAHNPYSVGELVRALEVLPGNRPLTVIVGCMADKDVEGMLRALLPVTHRLILTRADQPRAAGIEDLKECALNLIARAGEEMVTVVDGAPTVEEAIRLAFETLQPDDRLCIAGSLAIAGEARSYLLDGDGARIVASRGTAVHPDLLSD